MTSFILVSVLAAGLAYVAKQVPAEYRAAAARPSYWASWRIRHSRLTQSMVVLAVTAALGAKFWPSGCLWVVGALIVALSVYGAVWRRADCARWVRSIPTDWNVRSRWPMVVENRENLLVSFNPWGLRRWFLGPNRTPRIRRVVRDSGSVRVYVEMLTGQGTELWRRVAPGIGPQLGMLPPLVSTSGRRTIRLTFPISAQIPAWSTSPATTLPDLSAVPLAKTADRKIWRAPILGSHMLIAGATGSGKGSVLWSIVGQLAPGVHDGTVQLWAIDPKGGIELGYGEQLFSRFAYGSDSEQVACILEDAATLMADRLDQMRGNSRKHVPTVEDPFVVLIVDEFLALTAFVADKAVAKRIDAAHGLLLSQGRAPGVTMIAATQDVSKESLGSRTRDLIPLRVCLRVTDAEQGDMALGRGARARGAIADGIDPDAPGTAYVFDDQQSGRAPMLVRFPWWSDDRIQDMARAYAAPIQHRYEVEPEEVEPVELSKTERARAFIAEQVAATGELPPSKDVARAAGCSVQLARGQLREIGSAA